jgi:hypothetical protein
MTPIDRASMVRLLARVRDALDRPVDDMGPDLIPELLRARSLIAQHPVPWGINVHLAHVDHRHGANIYASHSGKALMAQLATFCREFWDEIDDSRDPAALDDETIVRAYFGARDDEYLSVDTIAVPGPSGEPDSLDIGMTLVASTCHIASTTALLLDDWVSHDPGLAPVQVTNSGLGWFFPSLHLDEAGRNQVPPDLAAVMDFASARGCSFILLDRDGSHVEGLDHHDW